MKCTFAGAGDSCPGREPQLDRDPRSVVIHARAAVDRSQHLHRLVRPGPAVFFGDAKKSRLHVPAGDGVERAVHPVRKIHPKILPVDLVRVRRAVGIRLHEILEGFAQRGQIPRFGPLRGGVLSGGHPAEQRLSACAGLRRGHSPVAPDDHSAVGGVPPPAVGPVVDQEGFRTPRLHSDAEARDRVVPGDPGSRGRLKGLHGAFGQPPLDLGASF